MKRTLSWLTLIGAALYAISTWPFADAVSVGIKNSISSETPSRGSPRESPPSQPSSALEQPVPDAAIEDAADAAIEGGEGSTEKPKALGETSGAVQAERLVVRSAANIRSRPSSKSTLIGTAQAGAELEVADREAGWVRFVDPATSYTGWIHEGLLTPLRSESAIEPPMAASAGEAVSPTANVPRRAVRPAASPRAPKQRVGGRRALSGYAQLPTGEELISGCSGRLHGGECSEKDCSAGISLCGRRDGREPSYCHLGGVHVLSERGNRTRAPVLLAKLDYSQQD